MAEQIVQDLSLPGLLDRHRKTIATTWAELVRGLPDSHYRERPLDELHVSTMRALGAIAQALRTGSYAALESYLADVSLVRLDMGFDIGEVIEALLMCKDAALPVMWEAYRPDSRRAANAITQLDTCLRRMIGRFGQLYAAAMNRSLQEQQHRTTLMLEAAQAASSSLDLDEVLRQVAIGIAAAVGVPHCGIYLMDETSGLLTPSEGRTDLADLGADFEQAFRTRSLDPRQDAFTREVLDGKRPVVCLDAPTDPRTDKGVVRRLGLKSILAMPFVVQDRVLAVAMLSTIEDYHTFTADQIDLAWGIANTVALTIENARLYQVAQDRQRELKTLLDVASAASSSLNLDEMLTATLDRLVALVGASRAGVMLLDGASGQLEPRMLRPERTIAPEDLEELTQACQRILAGGKPLHIEPDVEKGFLEPGAFIPLRSRGQVLGLIAIVGMEGGSFSQGQVALFESIADQLGVAVENARLYEQAEQAAVAMERSRLARDLHDAVTQTLFSASLIAEVLPRLWDKNQEEGRRRLQELRELTRGALAEMRTLLLELRPSAMAEADLGDLLRQLSEAIAGRARLQVKLEVEGHSAPRPEVKVALYRIAQEALNNVAKHAGGKQATIALRCAVGRLELSIVDDGRGFDVGSVPPDHLGLGIMRERAESIGATLAIQSEIGRGTQVTVVWNDEG